MLTMLKVVLYESGGFNTVTGLPWHPLLVHAVVVLVPLAALGTVAIAFVSSLRRRYGWLTIALFAVAAFSSLIAKNSGQALAAQVGAPQVHSYWGGLVPWIVIPSFFLTLGWFLLQRRADEAGTGSLLTSILAVVSCLAAIASLVLVVLAGHSGATAVWGDRNAGEPATASGATSAAVPSAGATVSGSSGSYTMAQVAEHADAASCWAVVEGKVYDLTAWVQQHPGGNQAIVAICGKDATEQFTKKHGGEGKPATALARFEIGKLA